MRKTLIIFILVACLTMAQASDQILSVVSSSKFRMYLSPTIEKLNVTAASKVELAIKTVLLVSSEETSDFESVFDIDIVLQTIEWGILESYEEPSTLLEFQVHMSFFKDNSELPSTFALDSLIVRTFSQPSLKSIFFTDVNVAGEVSLSDVKTMDLELAEGNSTDEAEVASSMSDLDIILILASVLMFFGVIYIFCQYNKDKARIAEQQLQQYYRWTQRSRKLRKSRTPVQDLNSTSELTEDGGNIIQETSSAASELFLEDGIDLNGSDCKSVKDTVSSSEKRDTPPISPCRSYPMSPIEPESLSGSPYTSRAETTTTRDSASSKDSNHPPVLNHLGSQLSSLPSMNRERSKVNVSQSSMSTDDDYMRSLSDFSASNGSSIGDLSSTFRVAMTRSLTHMQKQSSISSNCTVSSEKTERVSNCFDCNWSNSKKEALASGDDDSSAEDAFHINADGDGVEDYEDEIDGGAVVSEWMRSIHVVDSYSDSADSSKENEINTSMAQIGEDQSIQESFQDSTASPV